MFTEQVFTLYQTLQTKSLLSFTITVQDLYHSHHLSAEQVKVLRGWGIYPRLHRCYLKSQDSELMLPMKLRPYNKPVSGWCRWACRSRAPYPSPTEGALAPALTGVCQPINYTLEEMGRPTRSEKHSPLTTENMCFLTTFLWKGSKHLITIITSLLITSCE
jgi:hypothetical protein